MRPRILAIGLLVAAGPSLGQTTEPGRRECSLGQNNSIFAPAHWPDRDLDSFSLGELGILNPQYDHFYLFIAYRRLSGKSLEAADLERLRTSDPCWNDGSRSTWGNDWTQSVPLNTAIQEWTQARSLVGSPPARPQWNPSAQTPLGSSGYSVPNCNADAYRNAARVLRERLETHGQGPLLLNWAYGQDAVFSHCTQTSDEMPQAAPAEAPAWYRQDRAYQWAAAQFYAGHYQLAADSFDEIAKDQQSPWKQWAPYLSARAYIRAATTGDKGIEAASALAHARARLDGLLQSQSTGASIQRDARRLIQFIRLQTEPVRVNAELGRTLSSAKLPESIGQDIRDFDPRRAPDMESRRDHDNFAAWLEGFREGNIPIDAPANDLWLVARLQHAKLGDDGLPALLVQAGAVPRRSAAFLTARYHLLRLTSDHVAARRLGRELLSLPASELVTQDRNRIKALALPHAATLDEFTQLVYRQAIQAQPDPQSANPVSDRQGVALVNDMPLDSLRAMLASPATPARLRSELRGPVWVRALILKRWDVLRGMHVDMQAWLPNSATELHRLDVAPDEQKTALGALFLLRNPGLNALVSPEINYDRKKIGELAMPNMHRFLLEDGSRENWWCAIGPPSLEREDNNRRSTMPAPYLTAKMRKARDAEMRIFQATPNATDYLGKEVLAWAKTHPHDEALPSALRMLVRSARGGCVQESTKEIGRRAFQHLHRYFPKSEEAKLTPSHA